jgi:AraC family transcriptional regulator
MPGSIGLNAPGEGARLRWHPTELFESLHLYLPATTMSAAAEHLADMGAGWGAFPHTLVSQDEPLVRVTLLALEQAVLHHLPDLYAETAAHLLALHLASRSTRSTPSNVCNREHERMRRVDDFMRAHLSVPVSLSVLAGVAGCSSFQLIRFCKSHWKETPFARLTRLRMEQAQFMLRHGNLDIVTIALECGYSNPSHFATAFRRTVGMSPSEYRRI